MLIYVKLPLHTRLAGACPGGIEPLAFTLQTGITGLARQHQKHVALGRGSP
jgi:hypothetical protein